VTPGHKKSAGAANEVSHCFLLAGRLLVSLFALLVAATPWTEGYRLLDNFPHGQDAEPNLLALIAFLGLVLLLTRSCRKALRALVALAHWLATLIQNTEIAHPRTLSIAEPAITASPPHVLSLPLLI
jgi:hypothetical protein